MDRTRTMRTVGAVLSCGSLCGLLSLCATPAYADDIETYGEDVVVTIPAEQNREIRTMGLVAPQSSRTGEWVEVKRSENTNLLQTCEYYISPTANSDGSVQVTVRTTLHNKGYNGAAIWTTTKTLFDNGSRCGFIDADWDAKAYKGSSISQQATFSVRGGGRHRITSTETTFRGSIETTSGWDFTIDIPFVISSSAGEGGSISPEGQTLVSAGDSRGYDVSARDGWRIKDVLVDGTSVGARERYDFTNVGGDHSITATFQKVWNVKFVDGITGETIDEKTLDDGADITKPDSPNHTGWRFKEWEGDTPKANGDLTITCRYEPVISYRVPALLPCRILADGSVVVPSDYKIENLSVVPIRSKSIETTGMPEDASYELRDGDDTVHSWVGEDRDGAALVIDTLASKDLTLSVSDVTGDGAWRELANQAAESGAAQALCTIRYVFEAAS